MEPIEYVLAVRRRWFVLVLGVALGVGAGHLSSVLAVSAPSAHTFTATHVLAVDRPADDVDPPTLDRLAVLVTTDPIRTRVAAKVGFRGEPRSLSSKVQVVTDQAAATLDIMATARGPARAAELANAFASELVAYADEQAVERQQAELDRARAERAAIRSRIDDLDAHLAAAAAPGTNDSETATRLLQAAKDAAVSQFGFADDRVADLEARPPALSGVSSLVTANPLVAAAGRDSVVPAGSRDRLALGGGLGLAAGLVLALLLARWRPRVHTKAGAERS